MMHPLTKNYLAEDANSQYLIAKQGTGDHQALKSDAAAANQLGVISQPGDIIAGERMDVVLLGETEVRCGGDIAAGRSFTSDAAGKAVLATTGQRAVGIVTETGAVERIVRCVVTPHTAA